MNVIQTPGMSIAVRHALALAALAAIGPAQAVRYTLIDLGALAPGGASAAYGLNNLGQVVGGSQVAGREQAFSWTADSGMTNVNGAFYPLSGSAATGINDAGQIAVAHGNPVVRIVGPGGSFSTVGMPADTVYADVTGINAAGRVSGTIGAATRVSAFTGTGGAAAVLLPTADTQSQAAAINSSGAVAGSARTGIAAYRAVLWSPGGTPRMLDTLGGSSFAQALNDRGQVAGSVDVALATDTVQRAFVWSAATGMVAIGSLDRGSVALGINDAGQTVGFGFDTSYSTPTGAFLWTERTGMLDINTLVTPGAGQRLLKATAINQWGQVVGVGSSGRAALLTPSGDLTWQGASGGEFSDGRHWEMSFAPSRFLDAQVATAGLQTITLSRDTTVNSLGLGAASGGRPTLLLQDGATLSTSHGVTVRATGTLTGDGTVQGAVVNLGTVQGSSLRITGGVQNQGLVGVQGGTPGVLETDLQNLPGGQLRLDRFERLRLVGAAHGNAGMVEVRGGELDITGALDNAAGGRLLLGQAAVLRLNQGVTNLGQIHVGFGGAEVFGAVLNKPGGQIVLSGNSNTTFYDAVTVESAGELRVSAGSTALFFGLVRQASGALFTGTGTKFYEGRLLVGQSPGLGIDEGSVSFGGGSDYLAELGGLDAGSGFDKLIVGGALHFGGTLTLQSWDGFRPQAGQRYDLFDWGSSSGRFARIDASGLQLGEGLVLDTSQLYIDGSIGVTAVPEPASWALMGLGAVWLLRRARPVAGGRGAARS